MGGTRADLHRLMGPYVIKAALQIGGPVTICAMDYGLALAVRFKDRAIAGSVRCWDEDYAARAFEYAMSPLGAEGLTWLTIDRGKRATLPDDSSPQG